MGQNQCVRTSRQCLGVVAAAHGHRPCACAPCCHPHVACGPAPRLRKASGGRVRIHQLQVAERMR